MATRSRTRIERRQNCDHLCEAGVGGAEDAEGEARLEFDEIEEEELLVKVERNKLCVYRKLIVRVRVVTYHIQHRKTFKLQRARARESSRRHA